MSKGNRMDEIIRRSKEKQFRQQLFDMAAKNNNSTLMRAALSPETRVEVKEDELTRNKNAFARELKQRLVRKQLLREEFAKEDPVIQRSIGSAE